MTFLYPLRKFLFSVTLLLTLHIAAYANHLVGMDLYYTWVSGNTYKITLVAYGDCGSASSTAAFDALATNTPRIYIYNGGTLIGNTVLSPQPPGLEITPVCPAYLSLTQCTDPSFAIPGIKKFVYSTNYTLPGTSTTWRFLFTGEMASGFIAGRALSITNIASGSKIELVDTLNNSTDNNSNPTFTNLPTPFFCVSNTNNYNPGAVDPNSDSLRFFLVDGKDGTTSSAPGVPVSYIAPYTGTNPLAVSWLSFDQQTGQISFFPTSLQRSLVVYNVREFRGGSFIGSCQREMTFLVQTCTNTPPSGVLSSASAGVITDTTHFKICKESGPFTININPYVSDGTNITVTTAGLPAGLTFTTAGNGTAHPTCTISWTSSGTAAGSYTFYVTYTSSSCPLSATQTIAYTITILPQPTISASLISAANCFAKGAVSITPGGGPVTVKVSNATSPYDTIQTFTSISATFTDSLLPGTYNITAINSSGCRATTSITVTAPTFGTPVATSTAPSYCGANDGMIKLSGGLTPGTADSVKYYKNGVAQPGLYLTVAADGSLTMTGLSAGVYSNIIVQYGKYCTSGTIGPITISNPPFTMRAVTFTNPSYCGYCDGTIKLWGLHPGQTDTITYIKDGAAQPPIVATIGADSTVTITAACQGTYINFVARTAGGCVSNTLGPITLSAPPFTARTITNTNPSYCGLCDGTIKIWGLHPGQTDTVTYIKDGSAGTPFVTTVGTDSTITLTGMCAGTYVNFVVHTAGICSVTLAGPLTLTTPPFTMRAIGSTNPDYCGVCNGTIKLYGLHPGQTDTITYQKDGVAQTFTAVIGSDSIATITGLCAGVYSNFIAHTGGICVSNILGPVTLTVPPFTMRTISFTNPAYCGICNGTIKLYGLHPGQTDTITYTKDGVPQTAISTIIPADSTVTITGLCGGVYANFVAKTGGVCVSNTLGPVTLVIPPFTMRALTFINPDYCGICNGKIKLYGLYPGQVDTISYTKDGVAQPPLSFTVAADSTITLSGLCAGLYDNFVAKTGGVCVSNTLGPANLTVPPFSMRALSFTNPPFCGICTGTITLYGLHPGQIDTISYTKDGVPQTPVVFTIGPDSIAKFTGLCAGLYDNFVARTGGVCVSNTLGPANLTVPPFTMSYISFTNPTKCGFCDGYITLHGLYPGQTDTISYTLDGVAQTPISVMVNTDSTVILSGLCKGTYANFVAKTGGVCVSNTLGPVTLVDPPIIPAFDYSLHLHCNADTAFFTNLSSPAADLTYQWTFGDGSPVSTLTNPVHEFTLSGSYIITLHITNTRCVDSTKKQIDITNMVKAGFTASPDSFTCTGKPVVFTNTSVGTSLHYLWNWGDGTMDSTRDATHIYNHTGVYTVSMALSNYIPCRDTETAVITVDSISAISISASDSAFCNGLSATFTGIFSPLGNTGYRWILGDGQIIDDVNPITHSYEKEQPYTVTLQAFYRACPDTSATRTVAIFDHPPINIGPDTSICPGGEAIMLADDLNANNSRARWRWSTGQTTSRIAIGAPGTYWVTVTIDGCTGTDSVEVKNDCYMNVPNAFTPNNDGINDYFLPRPQLAKGLTTFKMDIYNRWGQVVFSTENIDGRGWDGRMNGVDQPEGVYVYMIEATFRDGQVEHRQGNVTLLR